MAIELKTKTSGEIIHVATLASNSEVVKLAEEQTITGNKNFTGTITVPDQADTENSTKAANTKFVTSKISSHVHGAITNDGKVGSTAGLVLVTGTGGAVSTSDITSTELGYLDGVTSNIQTQLGTKQASSTAVSHTASTAVGSVTQPVYIASDGTATVTNYSLAKSVPADAVFTDTVTTASTTGSGNAVTSITASNGELSITKGETFLTAHPSITKSDDTTSTTNAGYSGSFTVVDEITRDTNGHVTAINTNTITLPAAVNISGKADKATTLSGYGITDAKIESGVITLGENTITPITSLAGYATESYVDNAATSAAAGVDLSTYAKLASPALTGTPTAPTATAGTNTTQVATTAFVQSAVSGLVDSAPTTLDTLNELAAALGDDPNFATTVATSIGTKADKATTLSGYGITDAKIVSGTITLGSNTITPLTSHQDISGKQNTLTSTNVTTSGSGNAVTAITASNGVLTITKGSTFLTSHQDISGKANLASPTFTGTPTAPTATAGTNTTQIATTAFVNTAIASASSITFRDWS